MSDKLIIISIGPVQEFIASARKLRDLWYGSYLLSELSKAVAASLLEQGGELIFPAAEKKDELNDLSVANKVLALFTSPSNCENIIRNARKAWRTQWDKLASITLETIGAKFPVLKIKKHIFYKQVEDFGDFYAAWVTIDSDYHIARNRIEQLLAGRKNFREFSKPGWDGNGIPKNSSDGIREAITGNETDETPMITGLLKKNEKLDAIGCIKRFAPLHNNKIVKHFDDLSDIALIPYIVGIKNNPVLLGLLHEFMNAVAKCQNSIKSTSKIETKNIDIGSINIQVWSDLFYCDKKQLSKQLGTQIGEQAWLALSRLTGKEGAGPIGKYACILVGDGDRMGDTINAISHANGHKLFSKALSDFASSITEQISTLSGSCIYAGGDDVLAYVPLHKAIECAESIKSTFSEKMKKACFDAGIPGHLPTFSIGMVITHHTEPLSGALALARKAERIAKTDGGKDAFAIIQSKRSGSDITICGKWDDSSNLTGITGRLKKMIAAYNNDESPLPGTLGYQLQTIQLRSGDKIGFEDTDKGLIPKNAAAAMVLQLFLHKEDLQNKKRDFVDFLKGSVSIERLSNELRLAKQLAEAKKMAKEKQTEAKEI